MAGGEVLPDGGGDIIEDARPGRRILCDRRHARALAAVFDDPDAWFDRAAAADRCKHDRTSTVVRAQLPGAWYHLKRYNTKNAWHALRRLFQRSRAWNCWIMAQRLRDAGIPTAPAAAMIQEHFGPIRLRSYFITCTVAGMRLTDALRERPDMAPLLAQRVAAMFRALAARRLSHGDLKATNILVAADGGMCLLDLDAARRHRYAAGLRRAWLKDRARFLRNFQADPALAAIFERAIPAQPDSGKS